MNANNDIKVKVAIIGAGSAGLSALKEVKKETNDFLIINGGPYGTTCARNGCMPSKTFIQVASDYRRTRYFNKQGIKNNHSKPDYSEIMKYVRNMRDEFVQSVVQSMDYLDDKKISGYAKFIEPGVIKVNGKKVIAENIIIATGSYPIIPEAWKNIDGLITNENFFEQETLNSPFGFVGAGIIGLELSQATSFLDIETSVFEQTNHIGGLTDPEVNNVAIDILKKDLNLKTNTKAEITKKEKNIEIKFEKNKHQQFKKVLVAISRKPHLDGLDLQNAGVDLNENNIPSFDKSTMKIKDKSIYIAGDVNNYRPILHEASDEGFIAGYNSVHNKINCFKRRVPLVICFTEPRIVKVGKSYSEIKNIPHIIGETNFDTQGYARIKNKNEGLLRIYAEPEKGLILGSEMIAPEGEYFGHLIALSIQNKLTANEFLTIPFYHPSLIEGLKYALKEITDKVKISGSKNRLTFCDAPASKSSNFHTIK